MRLLLSSWEAIIKPSKTKGNDMRDTTKAILLGVLLGLAGGLPVVAGGALVLFAPPASGETYLHSGAWSHHIGSEYDYNETHNLLAVEHDQWIAGGMKNSFGDDTALAGYRFKADLLEDVEVSLLAGLTYGYREGCFAPAPEGEKKVCPHIMPGLTYTKYRFQPSISGGTDFKDEGVVVFSVRWEL